MRRTSEFRRIPCRAQVALVCHLGYTVLSDIVLPRLNCRRSLTNLNSQYALPAADKIEVVFIFDEDLSDYELKAREGWCPKDEDSVGLGRGLENILALGQNSSEDTVAHMAQELESRVKEVCSYSTKSTLRAWAIAAGWRPEHGPSMLTLDPSEDVDDSNWMEKGHYRVPRFSSLDEYIIHAAHHKSYT